MDIAPISGIKDGSSGGQVESGFVADANDDGIDEAAPKTNDTSAKQQQLEKRQRIGLFVFSAITATLYAGAFFSWGPMQLLLEAHGVFEDRCDEGESTPCPAQTTRLLTVQFIAQFAIVLSPILGVIADKYGAAVLMNVSALCGLLGLGLLVLATGFSFDNLVFVSFFLIGIMAMSAAVNTVQVGMLFADAMRQRVISALNTLFDAGLLTYLALLGIKNVVGCSLPALLLGYLAVGFVCFAGSIYYWRVAVPFNKSTDMDTGGSIEENVDTTTSPTTESLHKEDLSVPNGDNETVEYQEKDENELDLNDVHSEPQKVDNNVSNLAMLEQGDSEIESEIQSNSDDDLSDELNDVTSEPAPEDDDYVLIANRSQAEQLRSKQFLTLTFFFAIHATRDVFNLTTARDFLAYLGDDETGNKYLTIYTLLTPASILGLPVLDFVLTRYGYHAGLQTVNALALGQGIIMVSSDNLNVQVLGFIFASFFRCFMYTISLGILPTFLGMNVVGKATGIMPCVAGLLALVNIPLASWAVNDLGGNFFYPNLIYTILIIPCVFAAWVLGQGIKREDAAKKRLLLKAS